MPISAQHLAVLKSPDTGANLEIWRGPVRGTLDESVITGPWLPTVGAGWTDVTNQVVLSEGLSVTFQGRGSTITLTIADENRLNWPDDCSIALVAQAWDGSAYTVREVIAWAYLDGTGEQLLDEFETQTGRRTGTYQGYWTKTRVPAHRIGRKNLASGASVAGATPALASTTTEAPAEYISQDTNDPAKAIDQNGDTVYIGDIIADPTPPTLGDDDQVHILRIYAGRTTRSIGAGNEPIWIELSYIHQIATWSSMAVAATVPNLNELSSNTRSDSQVSSFIDTASPLGSHYRVRSKTGQSDPTVRNGVQWNLPFGLAGRALKMQFEYIAPDSTAIGRRMLVTVKDLSPSETGGDSRVLRMGSTWQTEEFDIDPLSNYGGIVLRVQNDRGEVASADLLMGFRFKLYVGYSDKAYAEAHDFKKLHLSWDNGAGGQGTQRIAWDLSNGTDDWTIPPLGTVIVTDDEKVFRSKFDPGTRQVFQMRNLNPAWFFGPGIGKLALRYGQVAPFNVYAPVSGFDTIETIDFTTNGLSWLPYQGASRQSPIGTGALTVEDYPHVGLFPGSYGGGFLWLNLGPFQNPRLALPLDASQVKMQVDEPERLAIGQEVVIGTERILVTARDDQVFTIVRAQAGTTAAPHNPDDQVIPRLNGANQTGPQWTTVEIRRKLGRAPLRSGVVIYSNLASPGDPSVGGSKWERHPDWTLAARFDNAIAAPVLNLTVPGGVVQARHVCVGDVLMHKLGGVAQRFKINELIVREYLPGAAATGGWVGHGAVNVAEAAAHILTQHANVPISKVFVTAAPSPMADLPIAASDAEAILLNFESDAGLSIWLDKMNAVHIDPAPSNPQFNAQESYLSITPDILTSNPSGRWGPPRPVAQVKVTAKESSSLRTYIVKYPDVPGTLGQMVEVSNINVVSWQEARARAEREYRTRNVRKTPQNINLGATPWAQKNLRLIYAVQNLDQGGEWSGVNVVIEGYTHTFTLDAAGGVQWNTVLTVKETVL